MAFSELELKNVVLEIYTPSNPFYGCGSVTTLNPSGALIEAALSTMSGNIFC